MSVPFRTTNIKSCTYSPMKYVHCMLEEQHTPSTRIVVELQTTENAIETRQVSNRVLKKTDIRQYYILLF